MKKPFFSIITCTYNSEKFIERNIKSVLGQTFKNYEHIFIDGYSKDKTLKKIEKYQKLNKSVKLFSFPPRGISDAFNKGIKRSKGEYLLFLNSDDYLYDKNVLEDVASFLIKNPDLDWIYGKISVVEEDGKKVGEFPKYKIFQISSKQLLKFINFVPHQAVFIKRKVFEEFGPFDESLETSMDYDYWLKIENKTKWIFFNRVMSNYTIRGDAKSSSAAKLKENLRRMHSVQRRYLNRQEYLLSNIISWFIQWCNKVTR